LRQLCCYRREAVKRLRHKRSRHGCGF
jgi:hypothetical protein